MKRLRLLAILTLALTVGVSGAYAGAPGWALAASRNSGPVSRTGRVRSRKFDRHLRDELNIDAARQGQADHRPLQGRR